MVFHGLMDQDTRFKERIGMRTGGVGRVGGVMLGLAAVLGVGRSALADPMYSIVGLGTLPCTSQSIATGIDASGQVTGVSYTRSDGTWSADGVLSPYNVSYDAGAKSFIYSNGQMTQIDPNDGPANAINDSGQVVGGHYSSINDQGQYVGSAGAGLDYKDQFSMPPQSVSSGVTTVLTNISPIAINNTGQMAGWILASVGHNHAAITQGGQVIDLNQQFNLKGLFDQATALSNSGSAIIQEGMGVGNPAQYLLYNPTAYHEGSQTIPGLTDLTTLLGGSGKAAIALNDLGQVVGNNFLYTGGQIVSLQGLLPLSASSHWSDLDATGINDAGQIVGQGLYDGKEQAFLMTPDSVNAPEPASWLIFGLLAGVASLRQVCGRLLARLAV
jgi:uncharacterized membrane protein